MAIAIGVPLFVGLSAALMYSMCWRGGGDFSFASRNAAAEYVEKGWIPKFIPASATDIHLKYFVDNSETWGRFAFAPEDWPPIASRLAHERAVRVTVPDPNVSWWDRSEVSKPTAAWFVEVDRSGGPTLVTVVDTRNSVAFFWRRGG